MLKWSSRPDPVFQAIVKNALEIYYDNVKEDSHENLVLLFGQEGLLLAIDQLIVAHNSNKIFSVTDYHFFDTLYSLEAIL